MNGDSSSSLRIHRGVGLLHPATYHVADPVPAEVDFLQRMQVCQTSYTGDVIARHVEDPQVHQSLKALNVRDLNKAH